MTKDSQAAATREPDAPAHKTPRHIAIIMDGNGRWAKERGLPRLKGHERGAATVRAVTEECVAQGVEFLTLYAFSTENWKRPDEEVSGLWMLLEHFLAQELPVMMKNGVRLRTIGRTDELPENTRAKARRDHRGNRGQSRDDAHPRAELFVPHGTDRRRPHALHGRCRRKSRSGDHHAGGDRLAPLHREFPRPRSAHPHLR